MKATIKGRQVVLSNITLAEEGKLSKSGKTKVLFFGSVKAAVGGKVVTINVTAYTPVEAGVKKGA